MPYQSRLASFTYQDLPRVIAHRGASGDAPENTLSACQLAVDQGARWIEVDIALAADGVPVVFHDENLERCSSGHGRLIQHTAGQLQKLDCGSWYSDDFAGESMLLLQQLLRFAARHHVGLNLEIKPVFGREQNTVWAIATLLRQFPVSFPIVFSSFNPLALEYCHQFMPEYSRAWLTEALPDNWLHLLERYRCSGIHYCADFHNSQQITDIREAGYRVLAYTVNEPEQAAWLLSSGVNAIFTDYPGKMQRSLATSEHGQNEAFLTH